MMAIANPESTTEDTDILDDIRLETIEEIPEPGPLGDLDVISVKREDTRGRLAIFFLVGFFIIMVIGMLIAALDEGNKVESVTTVLLSISGILAGPLGFVIGYYFRSRDDDLS